MFEMLHAVLTSLLLSAGLGCGAGLTSADDSEPVDSENGVDVGSMPSYLTAPRGPSTTPAEPSDDDQSVSLSVQTCYTEPAVWTDLSLVALQPPPLEVAFSTSGRSP